MPNQNRYQGTLEDHLAALERHGRRCDANGRNCVNMASTAYVLAPADGHGNPLPGKQPVVKKTCARHRIVFSRSGSYCVLEERVLPTTAQREAS